MFLYIYNHKSNKQYFLAANIKKAAYIQGRFAVTKGIRVNHVYKDIIFRENQMSYLNILLLKRKISMGWFLMDSKELILPLSQLW